MTRERPFRVKAPAAAGGIVNGEAHVEAAIFGAAIGRGKVALVVDGGGAGTRGIAVLGWRGPYALNQDEQADQQNGAAVGDEPFQVARTAVSDLYLLGK